mgnify:CR=1 FL=1
MALFRAAATVGSLTFLSRIAGFVRDILMAAILGAGPIADAFFVALKLPNIFRRITAEGAFSISFVPMFSGFEETKGRKDAMSFAAEAQAVMLAILLPFTVLMILAMPWIINVITPGFSDDPVRYDLGVELGRYTFPYILLMSLVALYGGVLNSFNRFAAFAVAPIFFNLTLIAALLWFTEVGETPAHALAVAVTISGVIQLLWMLGNAMRFKLLIRIDWPRFTARIKKLFRLMGPAVLGAGVVQINLMIDMFLASFLEKGAISYLYYADRLYQLPLSVVGIAIGTAMLPMLSRKIKAKDDKGAMTLMRQAILFGLILAVPAAAALMVLSSEIMITLFERGAFDRDASLASASVLNAYAFSLPAFILVKVFSTMFFAREDTKTPVKLAIIGTVVNTAFGIILIFPFEYVGIAMATAIAAWLQAILLMIAARKIMPDIWGTLKKKTLKTIVATALMMIALFAIEPFLFFETTIQRIVSLSVMVIAGGSVYFTGLMLTKTIQLHELKGFLKRKSV